MKRIFTRSYILDAAKQHKRVEEALLILLALILLSLGIAGFLTLLKSNLQASQTPKLMPNSMLVVKNPVVVEDYGKKNLLTYLFNDLKLSCSPFIDHSKQGLWNGICRSIDNVSAKSYILTIKSTSAPKRYKGFKLAKEVFYVLTKQEALLAGKHTAFSFSTFILGGGTFVKVSKNKASPIYMFGVGLGLGFLIDKKMQIEFKEITPEYTAKQ